MVKALKILKRNGYEGVIIPDDTPEITCNAPACRNGYMKSVLRTMEME
jgi:mannonate dehydratase